MGVFGTILATLAIFAVAAFLLYAILVCYASCVVGGWSERRGANPHEGEND